MTGIFSSNCEALVNPVNCVGVSGKGLALEFKRRYPGNYAAYRQMCKAGAVSFAYPFVFERHDLIGPRWIINLPTKWHWKDAAHYENIGTALQALHRIIVERQIKSIAIPALGCGLGGLKWDRVYPMINALKQALPGVRVEIYGPDGQLVSSQA